LVGFSCHRGWSSWIMAARSLREKDCKKVIVLEVMTDLVAECCELNFVSTCSTPLLIPPVATGGRICNTSTVSNPKYKGGLCRAPIHRWRKPYCWSSRFFWVPSELGSRFSWCLVALCPLLLVSATRLPNKTRPQKDSFARKAPLSTFDNLEYRMCAIRYQP